MSFARQPQRASLIKWVGTVLSVVLLIYLLSQQDWQKVLQALSRIPFWRFAVAFLLMFISRFAVATRWYVLLRVVSNKVSWMQSVRWTFSGLFASNFLPTTIGGDIVRLAGGVQSDLDAATTTASLVIDRLVGMFGMALMLPFGIVPLFGWFSTQQRNRGLSAIPEYSMVASAGLKKIWQKVIKFARKIFQSIKLWLKQPASLAYSFLFTGIHMLCFFGIFGILLGGLNDPISLFSGRGIIQLCLPGNLVTDFDQWLWLAGVIDFGNIFRSGGCFSPEQPDNGSNLSNDDDACKFAGRVFLTRYHL